MSTNPRPVKAPVADVLEAIKAMLTSARERLADAREDERRDPTRNGSPGAACIGAMLRAREAEADIEALARVETILRARQVKTWASDPISARLVAWLDDEQGQLAASVRFETERIAQVREEARTCAEADRAVAEREVELVKSYADAQILRCNIRKVALDDIRIQLCRIAEGARGHVPERAAGEGL